MEIDADQDQEYKPVLTEEFKKVLKDQVLNSGLPYGMAQAVFKIENASLKEWNIFKMECILEKSKN